MSSVKRARRACVVQDPTHPFHALQRSPSGVAKGADRAREGGGGSGGGGAGGSACSSAVGHSRMGAVRSSSDGDRDLRGRTRRGTDEKDRVRGVGASATARTPRAYDDTDVLSRVRAVGSVGTSSCPTGRWVPIRHRHCIVGHRPECSSRSASACCIAACTSSTTRPGRLCGHTIHVSALQPPPTHPLQVCQRPTRHSSIYWTKDRRIPADCLLEDSIPFGPTPGCGVRYNPWLPGMAGLAVHTNGPWTTTARVDPNGNRITRTYMGPPADRGHHVPTVRGERHRPGRFRPQRPSFPTSRR